MILDSASRLFAESGYAGTSMREIAHRADLRKASLYYYFRSKTEILDAMIRAVMVPPIEFLDELDQGTGSSALKLFRLVRFDVRQLCSANFDYTSFLTMPEVRSSRYAKFWRDRQRLFAWIEARVADGVENGEFIEQPIAIAAHSVFTIEEFTVHWYDPAQYTVDEVADAAARYAVRALMAAPDAIDTVAAACRRFDDQPATSPCASEKI